MTYAWLDVTRNAGIARIVRMSYRSKTYTWNDVILVKTSMIRVFLIILCEPYKFWNASDHLRPSLSPAMHWHLLMFHDI